MKQSLSEMAAEYDAAIEQLKQTLEKAKLNLKKAKLERNEDEYQRLLKVIGIYREELHDMSIISDTLRHYYDTDDRERAVKAG